MKKHERIREKVTILPTSMYLSKMHDAGWTLVALEWEREMETSPARSPPKNCGLRRISLRPAHCCGLPSPRGRSARDADP